MPPPPNWPDHVAYLSACVYHSSVSNETRAFLDGGSKSISTQKPTVVTIRRISSSDHPACGQFGLFAARKILANEHLLDYIGEIHCDERDDSDYDLSLWRGGEINVGIDASVRGNEGRFINDYRGIHEKPNAMFVDTRAPSGELRMEVKSSRLIKKGEEITVSYGKGWWQAR
ncbi:hypothetical protein FB45DRAFT_916023 [Roridomyces roridus]|uniref:SET domain-containing protein n=1 Tax=Roridomyces roridus TaxID=1738132 RepID=A0AAD7FL15_9AGAR|nr:hypothetical protein FB45DRAFT_916023 [Roridomyces roridus]